jgi:xanthine dehydrogenase YagS FAD-binding subunit
VATLGGSVLQRPRCWYYRLEEYKCLKKGGEVCYAVGGENRYHVIFGGGPSYAAHPSNSAVALVALGATFVFDGPKGVRSVAASEFFQLPSKNPQVENTLGVAEILTEVLVPAAAGRSIYNEVRERQAFDWPLVSVAAAVRLEGGLVKDARVVLGAVAPIPWRSNRAEAALMGRPLDEATLQDAARAAIVGAAPLSDNGYKVGLVQTLVRRTLAQLA